MDGEKPKVEINNYWNRGYDYDKILGTFLDPGQEAVDYPYSSEYNLNPYIKTQKKDNGNEYTYKVNIDEVYVVTKDNDYYGFYEKYIEPIVNPQPTVVNPQPTVVKPQPTIVKPQPTIVMKKICNQTPCPADKIFSNEYYTHEEFITNSPELIDYSNFRCYVFITREIGKKENGKDIYYVYILDGFNGFDPKVTITEFDNPVQGKFTDQDQVGSMTPFSSEKNNKPSIITFNGNIKYDYPVNPKKIYKVTEDNDYYGFYRNTIGYIVNTQPKNTPQQIDNNTNTSPQEITDNTTVDVNIPTNTQNTPENNDIKERYNALKTNLVNLNYRIVNCKKNTQKIEEINTVISEIKKKYTGLESTDSTPEDVNTQKTPASEYTNGKYNKFKTILESLNKKLENCKKNTQKIEGTNTAISKLKEKYTWLESTDGGKRKTKTRRYKKTTKKNGRKLRKSRRVRKH